MKLLVLATDYPSNNNKSTLAYIHTRNVAYKINYNIDVTVINFMASESYDIDGIKVITKNMYKANSEKYDILVAPSQNLCKPPK